MPVAMNLCEAHPPPDIASVLGQCVRVYTVVRHLGTPCWRCFGVAHCAALAIMQGLGTEDMWAGFASGIVAGFAMGVAGMRIHDYILGEMASN